LTIQKFEPPRALRAPKSNLQYKNISHRAQRKHRKSYIIFKTRKGKAQNL